MNNNALIEKIETLVKPIADELNYEVYHIEFVKENNELKYFIFGMNEKHDEINSE